MVYVYALSAAVLANAPVTLQYGFDYFFRYCITRLAAFVVGFGYHHGDTISLQQSLLSQPRRAISCIAASLTSSMLSPDIVNESLYLPL